MEAEAAPVRKELGLTGEGNLLAEGVTARLWSNESVHIVTNGSDSRFDIDAIGMVCDFCAQSIEKVFMKREEVQGINIDLENQKVIIYLKDNSNIEDELIVKLLEDSGYGVDKINRSI